MPIKTIALIITCIGNMLLMQSTMAKIDWRIDLLQSQGIPTTPESLKKTATSSDTNTNQLDIYFKQLGSKTFKQREQAQLLLTAQGSSITSYLLAKMPISNPEIKSRTDQILQHLEDQDESIKNIMTQIAAKSLIISPNDRSTNGQFYEWFGTQSQDCSKGYRQFIYQGPKEARSFIKNSQLVISGQRQGEHDQRIILQSHKWPNRKKHPHHIIVNCSLGTTTRASSYHVGITIGKIKALIHPGHLGGAFRCEQINTKKEIIQNCQMGYTPSINQLHHFQLTAKHIENEKVKLSIIIKSKNKKRFEKNIILNKNDIGDFSQISLDRSGKEGGDAFFDNLRIQIKN